MTPISITNTKPARCNTPSLVFESFQKKATGMTKAMFMQKMEPMKLMSLAI